MAAKKAPSTPAKEPRRVSEIKNDFRTLVDELNRRFEIEEAHFNRVGEFVEYFEDLESALKELHDTD